jgi:hypothetical protein
MSVAADREKPWHALRASSEKAVTRRRNGNDFVTDKREG